MFALQSLALNGETYESSDRVRRACRFLLDRQMADGGWGESYKVRPRRLIFLLYALRLFLSFL